VEGDADARAAWSAEPGLVFAAWHEQILLLPSGWLRYMRHWSMRPGGVAMLVSLSRDAEPVAKAIDHLGLTSIRGSKANTRKRDKDKGGLRAVAEALRLLKATGALCIAPDRPRGPARQVSDGPVLLARRAEAVIIPYALTVRRGHRVKSWDRMIVPRPFDRGAIVFGAPIRAPSLSADALRDALQAAMDAANLRAHALLDGAEAAPPELRDAA